MQIRNIIFVCLIIGILISCTGKMEILVQTPQLIIRSVTLSQANIYLIESNGKSILIDTGYDSDREDLINFIRESGHKPENIDFLIITHGHNDHAGSAAFLKKEYGIKIIAGSGDRPLLSNGNNGKLCGTTFLMSLLQDEFEKAEYETVQVDILIKDKFDMKQLGIDGRIFYSQSHTPGSLVLQFADNLFVGDLIRGGMLFNSSPERHFFICDIEKNNEQIERFSELPNIRRWFTGHYGPLDPGDIKAFLTSAD